MLTRVVCAADMLILKIFFIYLVNSEPEATEILAKTLSRIFNAPVKIAEYMERIEL